MVKQIWEFAIDLNGTIVEIPKDAEILTIQTQNETPYIWALVNPENAKELRSFKVYATGQDIRYDIGIKRIYINTFQLHGRSLVFHLFECVD